MLIPAAHAPQPEALPDLTSLALLVAVSELGSMSAAAARYGITQPAVSMRLSSLEHSLGLQLIERHPGGSRLTPAGAATVEWAGVVLAGVRSLLAGAAALRATERSQLTLASSLTVAEYLVPGWLQRLAAAMPEVHVSLEMGNTAHVVELVLSNAVELGFVEGAHPPDGLRARALRTDELVVVVSPRHPWARRRRPIGGEELGRTPLVLREHGSGTREVLEEALHAFGVVPTVLMELGSTTAIKAAVAGGAAPSVISALAVAPEVHAGQLAVVPLAGVRLERTIRAVWASGHDLSLPAARLVAVAASYA